MTAVRWWVKLYARWIAKIQSVQGQLNLFFTALSGVSLASGALKYFGLSTELIIMFLVILTIVLVLYTHLYSIGGVWNQVQRDKRDLSNNFAGPNGYIVSRIKAKAFVAGMQGEPLTDEQEQAIEEVAREEFEQLRDGVQLDD